MIEIQSCGLVDYREAHQKQLELVDRLQNNQDQPDTCLVLEHPPVFTLGRNGSADHIVAGEDFLTRKNIDVVRVERGGEVTYHGPGQLVCYPVVNLKRRGLSVIEFVGLLESIMRAVVSEFGIEATADSRNRGIWVAANKIGSIGIAVKRAVSFHGLALNVNPDLTPFSWITPCGLTGVAMTSMARELSGDVDIEAVRQVMIQKIEQAFLKEPALHKKNFAGRLKTNKLAAVHQSKPKWLKKRLPTGPEYERVRRLVGTTNLHTVCSEARCPNQFECYGKGTATFMIMGDRCTRNCRFCAVQHGPMKGLDRGEPERIAAAVAEMNLDYAVLTSVTRDDLPDGGAAHFVATIQAIRRRCPHTLVEVLIPDLQGDMSALESVCSGRPAVLNHNIETVAELYPIVRPQAIYQRSLELLRRVATFDASPVTKSGIMVGLGESREALVETMRDLRAAGCEILTIGQYLQPTSDHLPVTRFVPPEEFDELKKVAGELGFGAIAAGPHVRSSYRAGHLFRSLQNQAAKV
ncbi:MAG: lipoyl synthase [Desulfocapsaceae bacterium]